MHEHAALLLVVVVVRGVVDAGHHGVHLLGDGQDDGGAVAGDALLGEPVPELLHVLVGLDLVAVLVGSLEHEELADELEGVGDLLVVVGGVLQLLDGGRAEAGDLVQVARDCGALEVGHGALRHAGALGIISGFGLVRWGRGRGDEWKKKRGRGVWMELDLAQGQRKLMLDNDGKQKIDSSRNKGNATWCGGRGSSSLSVGQQIDNAPAFPVVYFQPCMKM